MVSGDFFFFKVLLFVFPFGKDRSRDVAQLVECLTIYMKSRVPSPALREIQDYAFDPRSKRRQAAQKFKEGLERASAVGSKYYSCRGPTPGGSNLL